MIEDFNKAKAELQEATRSFNRKFFEIRQQFDKEVEASGEQMSLERLNSHPVDFGLSYCLHESLEQCERAIKEKPTRELALVKTKIQEALHWLYD